MESEHDGTVHDFKKHDSRRMFGNTRSLSRHSQTGKARCDYYLSYNKEGVTSLEEYGRVIKDAYRIEECFRRGKETRMEKGNLLTDCSGNMGINFTG